MGDAQQIYSAMLSRTAAGLVGRHGDEGSGIRKHPSVAINAAGERLFAWTEGTAWARGGTVAWELRTGRRRAASDANAGACRCGVSWPRSRAPTARS